MKLFRYLYKGFKAGLILPYLIALLRSLLFYLYQFRIYLYSGGIEQHSIRDEKIKKLQTTALGLHALLPKDPLYTYSILIAVEQPLSPLFKECLESALSQTAPSLEILVGFLQKPSLSFLNVKTFTCFEKNKLQTLNFLAQQATGNFLFILEENDWMRPDLLYRFELALRLFSHPEKHVLYCNHNSLNQRGFFIPSSEYQQPENLNFPYLFEPLSEKGWLIPTAYWKEVGGLNENYVEAAFENLILNLNLAGCHFQSLPFALYSKRASKLNNSENLLKVLEKYSESKKLQWTWTPGYQEPFLRALPALPSNRSIQAIIPFKDQKALTLKCIDSLIRQTGVNVSFTAIDNRSSDPSIAKKITEVGGEVIHVDEFFNYSRLNNLAVKHSQNTAEILLFLNNDVELDSEALSEMLRWIHQPGIGMVGCRLHYPNGLLQHGGVEVNPCGIKEMRWEHIEKGRSFKDMQRTKSLGICKAVTMACAMIKRQIFLDIGGFDEIWYPIGYSDTHLAVKLAAKGLKCFYTPYAYGIHHESVSRKESIEDFENSWWLHHQLNSKR